MKRILSVAIALSAGLLSSPAFAGIIDASATISSTALGGGDFDYTIAATNTSGVGNDSIATFWFSWIPGENFMNTSPISVMDPTGWKDAITGSSSTGFAIQFDSLSAATSLAPGGTETFSFVSATTPAELAGDSPAFPGEPELTAFVYSQGPLEGDGHQLLVTAVSSVPEPSSLVLGLFGIITSFG
jgi:hypothetical protein